VASSRKRLSPAEIVQRLRAQFGDDVLGSEEAFGHAVVTVSAARYPEIASALRQDQALDFDYFDFLTGVDRTPSGGPLEVVVHLYSTRHNHHVRVKVPCDAADPHCPTVSQVWAGANWHERETAELFGFTFDGHPHPVKLLLPEQFEGHPLRKEFALMSREAKPWPGAVEGEEIEE
jgi:NADH-quinone oxidoreductase subunit C